MCSVSLIQKSVFLENDFSKLIEAVVKWEHLINSLLVSGDCKQTIPHNYYLWHFKNNDGEYWQYSNEANEIIEMYYSKLKLAPPKSEMNLNISMKINEFNYTIAFDSKLNGYGTQVNLKTNNLRKIKRINKKSELEKKFTSKELNIKSLIKNKTIYPSNWTQLENLSYKTSIYNTILVDLSSDEAKRIISMMKLTLANITVHSIERVQNLVAYSKYQTNKELLTKKYEEDKIEIEMSLFHGTFVTDPSTLIEWEEGFDMRFSKEGLWGRGIYFAVKASYSNNYAFELNDENKTFQMFLAKVLVGK